MDEQKAAEVLRNVDLRTRRMEQILPDLPTRDEVRSIIDESIKTAVAPLATKEELAGAVAKLATKEELADAVAKLATKEELADAVAKLATKEELAAAIEPLATRAELHEVRDELRRHMDVWAERIQDQVQMVAEAYLALDARDARQHADVMEDLRRLAKTDARQHADVMKDLAKLHARLTKVERKAPRKRRAS
jgi:predicted house-cleaning noncanonical NTP pyrophosphatase (MazG superfamily)